MNEQRMTQLFYAYATQDARMREQLERELRGLKQPGVLAGWHARAVGPGGEPADTLSTHVEQADVVLFLVSRDFVSHDYCHGPDVRAALDRHRRRAAQVIPVILRPCRWKETPFGNLPALPDGGKPVTEWRDTAAAFEAIAAGITAGARRMAAPEPTPAATAARHAAIAGDATADGSAAAATVAPAAGAGSPATAVAAVMSTVPVAPAAPGVPVAAEPAPAQVALDAQELGPEYEPLATPSTDEASRPAGTRYVSLARSRKHRGRARRVAQLVDRLESAGGAVARLEAAVRGEVAKGGQLEPAPAAREAIRCVYGARSLAPSVSVFAAKGRFLVAAKVVDTVAEGETGDARGEGAPAADAVELANAVVRRMLARIPG